MKRSLLLVLLMSGCAANAPPNLTPQATVAFKATQVVKALDALRDVAIAANAEVPPLVAEDVTRKVVTYHQAAVKTIQATPSGWKATTEQGLDELLTTLGAPDRRLLTPYATLIKLILSEVTK